MDQQDIELPIRINVIVTEKNGYPSIELRRNTTDNNLIKKIIQAAYHKQPLTIYPEFTDTMKSLSSLITKGILIYNEQTEKYEFTID